MAQYTYYTYLVYMAQYTYYIQSIWHNTYIKSTFWGNPVNFCRAEKQIICSMRGSSKYLKHEATSNNNQKFSS
jgi:hypothetical protein